MSSNRSLLTSEHLKQFRPLNKLAENQRILLADKARIMALPKRKVLFECGSSDHFDYFLLSGKIELVAADKKVREVEAGSTASWSAIAHLQPRQFTVKALSDCEFLVLETDVLNRLLKEAPIEQLESDAGISAADQTAYKVLMTFQSDLKSNNFTLPSLPDVAMRIRQVASRENSSMDDIAKLVNSDPAITLKLIKACNSPLYRGFSDITSSRDAVTRLGMKVTQQLVMVFAMRELFRSKKPELQKAMSALWDHSREVASIAYVLAELTPGLDKDFAMMAGLIHDVGAVPVICYAENIPDLYADPKALQAVIAELRGELGATMMQHWGMPAVFAEVTEHADNWSRDSGQENADYVDVVLVAQRHALLGQPSAKDLPPFTQIPAFGKLARGGLTPEKSLKVLVEARQKIQEVQDFLGADLPV
ncbi:MAG: HDOD domain-containing protein [Hahellaceae bacterium]|nr:HDOD domain-containing protein [Hahellaceae bacterium]MCP5169885.1 HDOD domain-containing protein [Hahellaceae bacterium]